ncbi:MAG TPA: AsmA family protein [Vicinamibacteria bacterium]
MKRILLAGGVVIVLLLLLGFGTAAYLLRSLNTPEFKKTLLERAKATVGAEVLVKEMDISVLSGVTLKGVTIANPAPFPGNLLTADAFVLRYRLRPLLSGRLEVERLALERPVVALAMDSRGAFNYEKLGGGAKAAPPKGSPASGPAASPIELVLKKLAVDNAEILMQDATKAPLMKVQDFDLDSAFTVVGAAAQGSGTARIATLSLADLMFVREISAPIEMSKDTVKLAPIRATLAGGTLGGDVKVNLKDGFRYVASLDVKGAQVQKLLEEAKSARAVSGTLLAQASVEGSGGLPTMKGKGRAEIADCKVSNMPVFGAVAAALRVPALSSPSFDQCLVEFTLGASRLQMTVISLKGRQMQLTGRGTTNLDTYSLDYDLNLALGTETLDKVPVRELKAAFKDRGDGFSAVDFKVTGTSTAPQTDLASRVGKAAATEAATAGLKKLFGKKKSN